MGNNDKDVATMGMNSPLVVSGDQLELIRETVAKGATDDELKLYLYDCKRHGVHPLDRMIFFVKRGSGKDAKATHQCSIDYFRSEAEASGEYDGQDEAEFEYDGDDKTTPILARVRIYRKGISRPFVGVARWAEFCPPPPQDFMWKKMPHGQLAKCAEAQGYRKAFPKKFAKLYTDDEMQQADYVDITPQQTKVESVQKKKAPASSAKSGKKVDGDVKSKFKALLRDFCGGDMVKMQELQKELTMYNDRSVEDVDEASDARIGVAYDKLNKKIATEYHAHCSHDPDNCDHCSVDMGTAFCGGSGEECPFQPQGE